MAGNRSVGIIIVLLTLLGMGVSAYLTNLHYELMIPGKAVDSICNINATVNCTAVSTSQYAKIGHFPLSGIGFIYYAICFLLSVIALRFSKSLFLYLFLFSVPAVAITIYMAYLSSQLGLICLFCLAMYAITMLLFALFPLAAGVRYRQVPTAIRHYLSAPGHFIKCSLATLLLIFIGVVVLGKLSANAQVRRAQAIVFEREQNRQHQATLSEEEISQILARFDAEPVRTLSIPANRPRQGAVEAPLQVIEFIDFQCPACKQAAEQLPVFLHANYPGKFSLVQLNFPLDATCNPQIKRKMHPLACDAALIGICVQQLDGEFWDYEEVVFANQGQLSPEKLRNWASDAGVSAGALQSCLNSPDVKATIAEDLALGAQAPVTGTPTLLLNGRNLQGMWRDPVLFKRIIEQELKSVE